MRPDLDQLFGTVNKIRELLLRAGAETPASTLYQDAIVRFVFGNEQLGGPLIEAGCHKGAITAQLAFLAKTLGSHLFVVEKSQELLSRTRSLLDNLNLNTHTTYHRGTLETFARDVRTVKKPLLLVINGADRHGEIAAEIEAILKLKPGPHAVAIRGSSPGEPESDNAFAANCIGIGEHTEGSGSEGIILFPSMPASPNGEVALVGPEARKTHGKRFETGFYDRFMTGTGLDVGFSGYGKGVTPILPGAIGVDIDYPGYDGKTLPFPDGSQDYVFTSHVLEHIPDYRHTFRDWHRVIKTGGHIVIIVPHQFLYEKRTSLPSLWNRDHKRFYTPGILLSQIEESLAPNAYRIMHLRDNDDGFEYDIPPDRHSRGCYEIECVIRKIESPAWRLA